ncbi:MAG: hypothetical protein CML20_11675 [Rheinheimera sp.]|nr:hypothetical protein [Rheinheimera sp.]|tara:strand:- start:3095 stop:4207 length:1113 start_codon:yes stop_codon:yes gene_type:complete
MSLNIYYVGPFDFPNGGAAARRIIGNVNTLRAIGASVTIVDGKYIKKSQVMNGIPVISVEERPAPKCNIFKKVIKYLSIGRNTTSYISAEAIKPDIIFLYSGYTPYLLKLMKFCSKNNIKLVFDCVEWYLPKSYLEYLYKPYYWNVEFAMRFLIPKCDGVVCISKYLESYYFKKNCKVINIPPTLSITNLPQKNEIDFHGKIKLVYTGSPGHKDKLEDVIQVITSLKDKFELNIAGIEGASTDNIHYHGILSHEKSLDLVSKSHFSVLLRPDNKVSKAGFSTKVVESMSCGTPVITNNTGDLDSFISDGVSGYIFNGYSTKELYLKLNEITDKLDESTYKSISSEALCVAKNKFESNMYTKNIEKFITSL